MDFVIAVVHGIPNPGVSPLQGGLALLQGAGRAAVRWRLQQPTPLGSPRTCTEAPTRLVQPLNTRRVWDHGRWAPRDRRRTRRQGRFYRDAPGGAWVHAACTRVVERCFALAAAGVTLSVSPLQRRLRDILAAGRHFMVSQRFDVRADAQSLGFPPLNPIFERRAAGARDDLLVREPGKLRAARGNRRVAIGQRNEPTSARSTH
jgi:hypothetical protein